MYEASIKRKERTEKYLASVGVPVNPNLPRTEDDSEVEMAEALDVARRSMALYCVSAVGFGAKPENAIRWLRDQNLWDYVSPDEIAFLTNKNPSERRIIEASWRVESLWTLLWSMGKIDSLAFPTTTCNVEKVRELMPVPDSDCGSFFEVARLRSLTQVLDQADLIYRVHWAVREAQLNGETVPCSIIPAVVFERHYALNWLVRYEEDWDEVTTDT